MHETRGFAFSPLVLSKRTSVLPFIPVVGYCNERRGKSETGQRRPAMVRSGDSGSIARANELTPHSIQEALRMYLQPIKHDDPQLDFYTMYKRETMEYDTEYMQKYNEDLNTTLIFVRSLVPSSVYSIDPIPRLVYFLRSAPPSSSTSNRTSSLIPMNNPKSTYAQSSSASTHPLSQAKSHRSPSVEWSSRRDRHNLGPSVCQPSDVAVGRICCDAGQTVAE